MAQDNGDGLSFWDHVDVLRGCLIRICLAMLAGFVAAFALKDWLFEAVLWPAHADFPLYRWIGAPDFELHLINTELTEQFMVHMRLSLMAGALVASPYILYVLFGFVSPALYERERKYSVRITLAAYLMFLLGVAVCYLLIFPLTVRFLGDYQVSTDVENMLSLSSYADTLMSMCLVFGVVFELPVVSFLLGMAGLLRSRWMTAYRRHAFVVILAVAAVLTPTGDMFTLLMVSFPIYALYELSALLVKITEK